MKGSTQVRTRVAFKCAAMLCAVTFDLLETSLVRAAAEEEDKSLPPAYAAAALVLELEQGGTHNMGGQLVRCQAGQAVGIWVNSGGPMLSSPMLLLRAAILGSW